MTEIVLAIVAGALVVVTLLGKVPVHDWWVRACEFPRVQIASLAALLACLSPLADEPWCWWLLLVSLLVVAWQLFRILPWTRFWPLQVQPADGAYPERCFTLMVANVLTSNRNSDGLIRQVRDRQPDMLLTLESDQWWGDRLDEAFGDWPCVIRIPLDNLYGMHLYSQLPLEDAEVQYLIQDDIPSIHGWLKLRSGHRVRFHALHPRPPAPSESEESLWRDAELLLVGREIDRQGHPAVVAGDLNDVAWSRTTRLFCKVSGMLDPRRGRGMFSTFHAGHWFLRWPLDHVFTSEHFTVSRVERLGYFGSDHFPMLVTLCYRPSRADEHETPQADDEDHREAEETILEGKRRDQQT